MITQLVLEDGWVGLALGPMTEARVAERSRLADHTVSSRSGEPSRTSGSLAEPSYVQRWRSARGTYLACDFLSHSLPPSL